MKKTIAIAITIACSSQAHSWTMPDNDIPLAMANIHCENPPVKRGISIKTKAIQQGLSTKRVPTTKLRVEGKGIDNNLYYPIGFTFTNVIRQSTYCDGLAGVKANGEWHVIMGYQACDQVSLDYYQGFGVTNTDHFSIEWPTSRGTTLEIIRPDNQHGVFDLSTECGSVCLANIPYWTNLIQPGVTRFRAGDLPWQCVSYVPQ